MIKINDDVNNSTRNSNEILFIRVELDQIIIAIGLE